LNSGNDRKKRSWSSPERPSGSAMSDETEDILIEFIQESRDHLAAIEPDLLELERQGESAAPEVVNRIFRAIHSTKGGASFLAFEGLKRFSHAMENVLMLVREHRLAPTSSVVDLLLRGVDVLRAMIEDIHNSDQVPCSQELEELTAVVAQTKLERKSIAAPSTSVAQAAEPQREASNVTSPARIGEPQPNAATPMPPPQAAEREPFDPAEMSLIDELGQDILQEVLATGKHLYHIRLDANQETSPLGAGIDDLVGAVNSVGQCLRLRRGRVGAVERFAVLCTSILEIEFFANAIRLPGAIITQLTVPQVEPKTPVVDAPEAELPPAPSETHLEEVPAPNLVADAASIDKGASRSTPTAEGQGQGQGQDTLRVRVDLLTRLMNVAGELVLGRNQLLRLLRESADGIPGLVSILQHVDRVTTELQEGIMQTRMQPVNTLFTRYARMARDIGRQLGKRIELETSGNEVELDKSIIEALADPLTHVVRNAIDHGIEKPEERQRQGKSSAGHVHVAAFHESGQVYIVVSDDGRGIDRARVRKKALEKQLVKASEAANLSDAEIMNLLLMPGFSTAEQITELSGRGVGMDVVRTNVEKLGGHVELESVEHKGTTVRLRLPLTLAIIPSLIIRVGEARYAVPQVNIVELVWVRAAEVHERIELVQGAPVLRLRGKLLPLVRLAQVMRPGGSQGVPIEERLALLTAGPQSTSSHEEPNETNSDLSIVVLRAGNMRFGVLVDELFEWEEIVVKPVPSHLIDIGAFAGTTILGDGRVIMILDPGGIAKLADLSVAGNVNDGDGSPKPEESDQDHHAVILFSNSPGEQFAVPQDRVLRLERIVPSQLEHIGGRCYVKYRGQGLPVVKMDSCYPVSAVPKDADELFLIIPREDVGGANASPTGGILVWRILDALDVNVALSRPMFTGPGIIGSAIVEGTLTMFMDPGELLAWVKEARGAA
jgi:two-component system, chemotaxis family, sensor kinase CheA